MEEENQLDTQEAENIDQTSYRNYYQSGLEESDKKDDDLNQIYYPYNPKIGQKIPLNSTKNWTENGQKLEDSGFLEILKDNSAVCCSNHPTYPTPIILSELLQSKGVKPENICIVWGGRIPNSHSNLDFALSSAAGIKMIPPLLDGSFPPEVPNANEINKKAILQIARWLKTPGNVLIYCPSGSTDISVDNNLILKRPADTVQRLLSMMNQRAPIIPIGFNETDTILGKNEKFIPNKNIEINFGEIIQKKSFQTLEGFMSNVATLVRDKTNKVIGYYPSEQEYKEIITKT